ncbi:MAG: YhfC family intramembrane metalloprotease [Chloroflexi bacterium]|nr:YhfC family intramembrane metalloprotease [Chloroflexota bacterium]
MATLAYTLAVLGMILLPVVLATFLRRRVSTPWALFLAGCATFVVSQIVHLPLNRLLSSTGVLPALPVGSAALWRTAIVLGLSAGVCEELARLAGYALLKGARGVDDALMLGLGHGGIESMVIGGVLSASSVSSLLALRGVDLASIGLPAEQAPLVAQQIATVTRQPWLAVLPLLERAIALALHVTLSLAVWQGVSRRQAGYAIAAIVYHALVDMVAVLLAARVANPWLIEAALLACTLPGLLWARRVVRRDLAAPARERAGGSVWAQLAVALRKEWLELRRTRRLLVILVVFALFGMTSPLLARFTPEIVASVPGAEMFAGLIPEPSSADAVAQYVKNLTQFGFILAILLGMGAVAGEKERGTAAMVLAKPLERATFVLSKFVAQAGAYGLALLVGAIAGYYYAWVLFGDITVGAWALITFLLFVWLLVFVAVALLGSTLGKTIGAGAGIGLALAVVLLAAGSVPRWGALAPGGLVTWAGQVGSGATSAATAANGGALAMAVVLIVLCLVGALAAIERQEL